MENMKRGSKNRENQKNEMSTNKIKQTKNQNRENNMTMGDPKNSTTHDGNCL